MAATLKDRGGAVHLWTVHTADEPTLPWEPGASIAIIGLAQYQPLPAVPFDAVQERLDRYTGELFVWDGRGILSPLEPSS